MPAPSPLLFALLGLTVALAASAGAAPDVNAVKGRQQGESLVLAGTDPGQLVHHRLLKGSVAIRSTYLPALPTTVVYTEGKDFKVDYDTGQVRRLEGSRIPDYKLNSLYGKKDFNHVNYPGFGNYKEFVFVDYGWSDPVRWPSQPSQVQFLPRTWTLLKAGQPVKVVAFGDSITAGGDATRPELIYWQQWLTSLRARYPKAQITGVNGATGGDTTVQGLARLEQKVLAEKPDLVLIAFGMNDQNIGSVPLDRFEANLGTLVDRIRTETGAEVILLSSCLPNPNWHYTSGKMPEYGRITQKVAQAKGCAFADVLARWQAVVDRKKPEDLLSNNVNHPNDFGHRLYAEVLEQLGL